MRKLFIITLCLFFFSFSAVAKTVVDRIIAKVGPEVITLSDLAQERKEQKAYLLQTYGYTKGGQEFAKINKDMLGNLILKKILKSETNLLNISASGNKIDQEYKQRIIQKQTNEKAFAESLSRKGLSVLAYKEILKQEIEKRLFIQRKIVPLISISEYDLQQEYKNNIKKYQTYNKLRFIEVFLTPDKFDSKEELSKMAKQIQKLLKNRRPASAFIKKYSSGAFAQKGGNSGMVEGNTLRPEVQGILNSLKPGETSHIIPIQNSVLIFKLLSKADPSPLPYNKAVAQVRMDYAEKLLAEELRKHLLAVKDKTYVEILK